MRLNIMRKTEVALRALRLLESDGGMMNAAAMARDLESTSGYLPHVLAPLIRAGWVASEPGPNGGYRLTAALADWSLLDLIELFEGPTDDGSCVVQGGLCGESPCAIHAAWAVGRTDLVQRFSSIPLSRSRGSKKETSNG